MNFKEGDRVKLISLPTEILDTNSSLKIGMLGTYRRNWESENDPRVSILWDIGLRWNCLPIHITPAKINWRERLQK